MCPACQPESAFRTRAQETPAFGGSPNVFQKMYSPVETCTWTTKTIDSNNSISEECVKTRGAQCPSITSLALHAKGVTPQRGGTHRCGTEWWPQAHLVIDGDGNPFWRRRHYANLHRHPASKPSGGTKCGTPQGHALWPQGQPPVRLPMPHDLDHYSECRGKRHRSTALRL